MITELRIEGYKSFGTASEPLSLGRLNFLVGPNASGKTNLLSALRFLQTAAAQGADEALKQHGGAEAVFNRSISQSFAANSNLKVCYEFHDEIQSFVRPLLLNSDEAGDFKFSNWRYRLELNYSPVHSRMTIPLERLTADVSDPDGNARSFSIERYLDRFTVDDPLSEITRAPAGHVIAQSEQDQLAISASFVSVPALIIKSRVAGWRFYDLRPEVMRRAYKKEAQSEVGPYGENLAVVLDELKQEDPYAFQGLISSLQSVIPGLENVEPLDLKGDIGFRLVEEHVSDAIESGSASDGTIRLLCLLAITHSKVRIYGQKTHRPLIAIEEPETGLHPHLSEQIVDMLRSASEHSQIIVTTHSPAFLDYLEPDEVILCDKVNGCTQMRRASTVADIDLFRKNFTLGELWLQGPLGAVP